ncbi:unnamed protein product [Bursaphelenchus xylophilus]|uniref:(pine wood nematode) hypothetical protein n=1 Tax=Bursaphelenchus xylophilus TaxID=6326 RepID=A0A1I7SSH1_BURXY|nr:unnamed protein product [Bursaphelenchus xylophilus]CAG9097556.1 unnamed protein product [Bursaphelenchus xylophilus]
MNSLATTSADAEKLLVCSICYDVADGQHFGANSCRACAAFFRRTISKKLKYICRFDGDCEIAKVYRSLCRACRLDKCLACGMNASAVRSECAEIVRPPKAPRKSVKSISQDRDPYPHPPIPSNDSPSNGVYVWDTQRSDSNASGAAISDVSYPSTSASSWPRTSPTGSPQPQSFIHDIVDVTPNDYGVDSQTLPPTHPSLMKMLLAYENIQRLRDATFNRSKECNGFPCRVYTRIEKLDMYSFYTMTQAELRHIAEFLNMFDGYKELPHEDKVEIFRHYWIRLVILERNFDTYRVLGGNLEDKQIVFPNGDIVDVINCEYDVSQITDVPLDDIRRLIQPWYKLSAKELIQPVKKLGPSDVEMMFCLGYMLWHFSAETASKLSPNTVYKAEQTVNQLYDELCSYYSTTVSVDNVVRRVAELMSFISSTEKIVMFRKEDIILARTFLNFKVDIFMEELFEKAV